MNLKASMAVGGLLLAAALGGAGAIYWNGRHDGAAAERPKSLAAAVQAAASGAQAAAALDAGAIADRSSERALTTVKIEGDHRAAIQEAAGADARLDPAVLAAARRGLCQYASYAANPGCAVLTSDSTELPEPDSASSLTGG